MAGALGKASMGCGMLLGLTGATQNQGAKREHPPAAQTTGDGKEGFALKIALCPNRGGFFLILGNTQTGTRDLLSWDRQEPPRDPLSFLPQWPGITLDQALVDQLAAIQ